MIAYIVVSSSKAKQGKTATKRKSIEERLRELAEIDDTQRTGNTYYEEKKQSDTALETMPKVAAEAVTKAASDRIAYVGSYATDEGECIHDGDHASQMTPDTQIDVNEAEDVAAAKRQKQRDDGAYEMRAQIERTNAADMLRSIGMKNAVIAAEILKRPRHGAAPRAR